MTTGIIFVIGGFLLVIIGATSIALNFSSDADVSVISIETEKHKSYQDGLLFGQAWAYSSCPSQSAIRQRWIDQATAHAKYGYSVEDGHIRISE